MRLKPTIFEFTSYKFDPIQKRIFFNYKTEFKDGNALFFTETVVLPEIPNVKELPPGLLDKIFEGLHLVIGVSYWKSYCATKIRVNYSLSKSESDFWDTVYRKGLGEFFYKNNLDTKISPKFPFKKNVKTNSYKLEKNNKCLVGISGGKDSIVAVEILKEQNFNATAFFTETQNESSLVNAIINITGTKSVKIRRILDEKLFDYNKYAGHVPVSAIYAFLNILCAVLYEYSYCIVANEYSSNFGNTKHKGEVINHQWSKSSEFENLFVNYVKNFITPDVHYFSLLRPFYEIRIVELFSKYKKYFSYFSSCNKNFIINKNGNEVLWCGECPKCVFVFILLSAFLSKKELVNIFNKNLYEEKKLMPLFKDVLGFGKIKPFDCVGTFQEARVALYLASPKFKNNLIIKTFLSKIKEPKSLIKEVFGANLAPNIPSQFRFSGIKNVLILGYGKEGEVTKKYIQKNYPKLEIGIADIKFSKNYLDKQKDYDLAIKSPGIPKSYVKINHTTATNIFFAKIKQLGNKTIGITGSKGKSTTTQLIYSILKESGKDARILGNIGNPMLQALLGPIKKGEIFVLELSSYQLDDIDFSPNIAVITNLFQEHMDYHSGAENYYLAKQNIINFQSPNDIFIYNPKYKKLVLWAKKSLSRTILFPNNVPLENSKIPLIGGHNKENIKAAIAVANIFGVSDALIKKTIKNFKSLPHRLEFVGEFYGIKFYDDGSSTNPESAILAIRALKNIDTIFLGGEDRGYDFSQLEKTIKKYKIRNIVLFPDSGNKILKSKKNFNILYTSKMKKAVDFAYKNTKKGKICLLSGAAPSYSLWKNFGEKGDQFQQAVNEFFE
ncbi:MAG: UDP-N-acetylmuramoyl-L-alanine--D-glutamate ligase [Candidatus Staskawiczbacteria bacterium]|nr:UDP-N-acetylmuramoyl-L-alanine--D-glutamate ligase [Candidatus Staskawiczbacteria bacterium]